MATPIEVPEASPTPTDIQNALLLKVDDYASNLSESSLQLGWVLNELWHYVEEEFMEGAGGNAKKALTAFTDLIQDREATKIESRSIISDRFHIARLVNRETYDNIVAGSGGVKPTFHQIRACVFTTKEGELDEDKFDAMVQYGVDNGWPPVKDMRIKRAGLSPEIVKVVPSVKHWQSLVKLAQTVMVDTATDGVAPNAERFAAAAAILEAWKKETSA